MVVRIATVLLCVALIFGNGRAKGDLRVILKTSSGDSSACNAANRYLFRGIRVTKSVRHGTLNIDFRLRDSVNFKALDVCMEVVFLNSRKEFIGKVRTPDIRRMSNIGRWCGITIKVDVAILNFVKYIEIGVIPHIDLN